MTTIVTNYDKMPKTDFEVLFSYLNSFVMHEHFIFSVSYSAKVFMWLTSTKDKKRSQMFMEISV